MQGEEVVAAAGAEYLSMPSASRIRSLTTCPMLRFYPALFSA